MAIYGFGAMFGGTLDKTEDFMSDGVVGVGWTDRDSFGCRAMVRGITVGDIAFIKAYPPNQGLILKAVGVVLSNKPVDDPNLGYCVKVRWEWGGTRVVGKMNDKLDFMRRGAVYPEHNPDIQSLAIRLLLKDEA